MNDRVTHRGQKSSDNQLGELRRSAPGDNMDCRRGEKGGLSKSTWNQQQVGALDTDKDILHWAVSIVAAANSGSEQKVFETGKLKKNRRIKANASTSKNGGDSGPDGMSLKIMREQNQMHLDNHCHCQHILMHMLEYAQILCVSLCLCL